MAAAAGLAAVAIALTACEPLEFYELTEPVPGLEPLALVTFQTDHDEALNASLAVTLEEWSTANQQAEVRLDGAALTPHPQSSDQTALFQHTWAVEPDDTARFPLTLTVSPPPGVFPAWPAHFALPLLVRDSPRTVCVEENALVLNHRIVGDLSGDIRWTLDLRSHDGTRLILHGQNTPAPTITIPTSLFTPVDGGRATLTVYTNLIQEPLGAHLRTATHHTVHWRVAPPDQEPCAA